MNLKSVIYLDLARTTAPIIVFAKQGDANARQIEAHLLNNGQKFEAPEGTTAIFSCKKPDGKQVYNDENAVVSGSVVTITLTANELAAAGNAVCDITLYDKTNVLGTQNFILFIERTALVGAKVESSDDYMTFKNALGKIPKVMIAFSMNPDGEGYTTIWREGMNYVGYFYGDSEATSKEDFQWVRVADMVNISQDYGESETLAISQKTFTKSVKSLENRADAIERRVKNLESATIYTEKEDGQGYVFNVKQNALPVFEVEKVGTKCGLSYDFLGKANFANIQGGIDGLAVIGNADPSIIVVNGTLNGQTDYIHFQTVKGSKIVGFEPVSGQVSGEAEIGVVDSAYAVAILALDYNSKEMLVENYTGIGSFFLRGENAVFKNYTFRLIISDEYEESIEESPVTAVKAVGKNILPNEVNNIANKKWYPVSSNKAFDLHFPCEGVYALSSNLLSDYFGVFNFFVQKETNGSFSATNAIYDANGKINTGYYITENSPNGYDYGNTIYIKYVEGEKYRLYFYAPTQAKLDAITDLQIERVDKVGDPATPYAPYTERIYPIPDTVKETDGYGLGISDTIYNYIDFENRVLMLNVAKRAYKSGDANSSTMLTDGNYTIYALEKPETVDVSDYLAEGGTFFETEGNGFVYFENEKKNDAYYRMTFAMKKE
jgi:hypothetical protein